MERLPLPPRKGFGLLFCFLMGSLLAGCITVDCNDCQKCAGVQTGETTQTGQGELTACLWRPANATDKATFGCPNGGRVCTGGGSCAGTCKTTVSGGTCFCGCQ
jgi:hypothetical protein